MQEMNMQEVDQVNGGVIQFVLGAIAGGLLYDAGKAGVMWLLDNGYGGRGEFPSVPRAGHE